MRLLFSQPGATMVPRKSIGVLALLVYGARGFLPPCSPISASIAPSGSTARAAVAGSAELVGPALSWGHVSAFSPSFSRSGSRRGSAAAPLAMTISDNTNKQSVIANVGALSFAAGCSAVASAIAEISPHAAAFVQLVCLSIWLGMSVYATFIWPIITGINMRDSSEFASLLGKLGPSYLQVSVAMIMSLGTSSVVIGHANEVQLVILGIALSLTLYNALILEPSAVVALEEEQAAEKIIQRGSKKKGEDKVQDLPRMQANLANFLGAEVLLDFLCILCAVCYAWDLASSITFA